MRGIAPSPYSSRSWRVWLASLLALLVALVGLALAPTPAAAATTSCTSMGSYSTYMLRDSDFNLAAVGQVVVAKHRTQANTWILRTDNDYDSKKHRMFIRVYDYYQGRDTLVQQDVGTYASFAGCVRITVRSGHCLSFSGGLKLGDQWFKRAIRGMRCA